MNILKTARARGMVTLVSVALFVFGGFVVLLGLLTHDWAYALWTTVLSFALAAAFGLALRFIVGAIGGWIARGESGSD